MNEHSSVAWKFTKAGFDSYQNFVIYEVLDLNASRKPV